MSCCWRPEHMSGFDAELLSIYHAAAEKAVRAGLNKHWKEQH